MTERCVTAEITLLREGGRRTAIAPRGKAYRPHLIAAGSNELLGVEFVDGPERVAPGETATVRVRFLYEAVNYEALKPSVRFTIVEGPKTIGHGRIISVDP